jgi:phosphoribosylformylglycinamidine synthase
MAFQIEITIKPELFDAEGEAVRKKADHYFGIHLERVRVIQVITVDAFLTEDQKTRIQTEIFTNPVTQISSFKPLPIPFDHSVWVGFRPGVRDNPGATAVEAIEDVLGAKLKHHEAVYTSKRYCLSGKGLTSEDAHRIAAEILANDIIQQWKIISFKEWDPEKGLGMVIPKVILDHTPTVETISIRSDEELIRISRERNLALNPNDVPVIRKYFLNPDVLGQRKKAGLSDPTDLELEYISQARSDHCNHNTFGGLFRYIDLETKEEILVDSLFKTCIQNPTLELAKKKAWVVSVLWDNAGIGVFDEENNYVITGETHNSPSNMEAYGGAITGIVGVYRDPMGTGKGAKLVMGGYGFCTGPRDYSGNLKPRLAPRRLLDGIIEGVKDGGNKSGIPTTYGQVMFHPGYLGKCLVFVTAVGMMPSRIKGEPSHEKKTSPGELIIMCGGRVGKDGIHGVTASSEVYSEHTPAGHVQIGDPYTQKKMHDFLLEARDGGLMEFITDNGGGGLSSSIGETARFSNGCEVQLEKVPLKYDGLDQWEIWVSESQERMTVSVKPENLETFMALSNRHAVESTVIGKYTDTGKLHITYNGKTCAYIDLDLLTSGFPQWIFDARWQPPGKRGLFEPVIREPETYSQVLLDLLASPNIASKEWITRQYDHEVQGASAIKPLVGKYRDVPSDAVVIRPVLDSMKGLAFAQALIPQYSAIDAYHMVACTMDEAVRRLVSVGGDFNHIGGVDNFCWPNIQYHPHENPDGMHKAAQLVRASWALKDICLAYGIPLLSGKDSMYVDGYLTGKYGEAHKVSALETMQFSTIGVMEDVSRCATLDCKMPGDKVYVLGKTFNELGGSAYYELFGNLGLNVPEVRPEPQKALYRKMTEALKQDLPASVHGIYRGGLLVHLALVAMAGDLGLRIDLSKVPVEAPLRNDAVLFSESSGRFMVTVSPENDAAFNRLFADADCACIGTVLEERRLMVHDAHEKKLVDLSIDEMKTAWKKPFGDLI